MPPVYRIAALPQHLRGLLFNGFLYLTFEQPQHERQRGIKLEFFIFDFKRARNVLPLRREREVQRIAVPSFLVYRRFVAGLRPASRRLVASRGGPRLIQRILHAHDRFLPRELVREFYLHRYTL